MSISAGFFICIHPLTKPAWSGGIRTGQELGRPGVDAPNEKLSSKHYVPESATGRYLDVRIFPAFARGLLSERSCRPSLQGPGACSPSTARFDKLTTAVNASPETGPDATIILHVSYAVATIGFLLNACGAFGNVPATAGIHACTVKAAGSMATRPAIGITRD